MKTIDLRSKTLLFGLSALSLALTTLTSRAQLPWKSPHGIFVFSATSAASSVVDGWKVGLNWSDLEPEKNVFDWSKIDTQVAQAQQMGKQFGISLAALSVAPAWLTSTPGVKTYSILTGKGSSMSVVLPWDPIVQKEMVNFITQLCQRYDGVLDYIVMGGLGIGTESYMPDPAALGMTSADAIAAWIGSSNAIIDAYATHLQSTPCIMAAAMPFVGTDAATALSTVVDRAAGLYPQFGVMNWGLNANSTSSFLPNSLIAEYSPTHPAGFQLACPVDGNASGKTLGGTLAQAMDAGIALGAQWIEVYGQDATNPVYAQMLKEKVAQLAPPASGPDSHPSPTPSPTPPNGVYLLNLSTRVRVQTADQVMIGGFIISGTASKTVVIRALGPSLTALGVKGALADPVLSVYDSTGKLIAQNDNYTTPLPPDVVASGLTPKDPAESLVELTLPPGQYTAQLKGANGCTGVALCELYDTDPGSSQFMNMSTRGLVGTGDDAMIGGFIVGGTQSTSVMIRALGPSLTKSGVQNALADPILELRDAQGSLIFTNDNWKKSQQSQILASKLAPSDNRESAIIATLDPGSYTALVRGAGSSSGVALVEVYSLQK